MRYKLSFSAGSLLVPESVRTARLYRESKNWDTVKRVVHEENAIQKVRSASVTRMLREIQHRLSTLTSEQLDILVESDGRDQSSMLYLAVCKYYQFLRDFVVDVVRTKVLTFDNILTRPDYERFIDGKSTEHHELTELSPTSAAKLRQVTWRILAEAHLLDSTRSGVITPFIPSPTVIRAVVTDDSEWLKVFLMSDTDVAKQELTNAR